MWTQNPARGVTCYFSQKFSITYAPTWVRKFSQKCPAPHGSVFLLTTADRGNTLCLPLPGLRVLFSESRYHNFDVQFKKIFFLRPKNIVPGSDSDIILVVKWNDYVVLNPNLHPDSSDSSPYTRFLLPPSGNPIYNKVVYNIRPRR